MPFADACLQPLGGSPFQGLSERFQIENDYDISQRRALDVRVARTDGRVKAQQSCHRAPPDTAILLRSLPHELKCVAGRGSRINKPHLISGDVRNDTLLLWPAD